MKVNQRDVVFINFPVGYGQFKPHPAIVLSSQAAIEAEDQFLAVMISHNAGNEEFIFQLQPEMLTQPPKDDLPSFVKCQLIDVFTESEVIRRWGSIKPEAFRQMVKFLNLSVFEVECK
ncbi:MAG: type II toxin-antitoxin system PemK/MazF family toxin [Cytophagales bacterium]|jgi:hypothetical protein|nr:type II toxin-antitoxin system PemK/MazF family toxin [Cytophagales bacterium]